MQKRIFRIANVAIITAGLITAVTGQGLNAQGRWVSAWSTAVQTQRSGPIAPPSLTLNNQTVRMVIRPTISGQRLRVRLSNEFGSTPLVIGGAHIALVKQDGAIVPESDHPLTFAGKTSISTTWLSLTPEADLKNLRLSITLYI